MGELDLVVMELDLVVMELDLAVMELDLVVMELDLAVMELELAVMELELAVMELVDLEVADEWLAATDDGFKYDRFKYCHIFLYELCHLFFDKNYNKLCMIMK